MRQKTHRFPAEELGAELQPLVAALACVRQPTLICVVSNSLPVINPVHHELTSKPEGKKKIEVLLGHVPNMRAGEESARVALKLILLIKPTI